MEAYARNSKEQIFEMMTVTTTTVLILMMTSMLLLLLLLMTNLNSSNQTVLWNYRAVQSQQLHTFC